MKTFDYLILLLIGVICIGGLISISKQITDSEKRIIQEIQKNDSINAVKFLNK